MEPGSYCLFTRRTNTKTRSAPITKGNVANLRKVPDILGFDSLTQNGDRHCDNVGVLGEDPDRLSYHIFDHGHAFGGRRWDAQSVQKRYQNMQPGRRRAPGPRRTA